MKRINGLYIIDVYLLIVILISGFAITSGTNLLSDGYTGAQSIWMKLLCLVIFIFALVPLFIINSKILFYRPSILKIVLYSIIFIVCIVDLFLFNQDIVYSVTKYDVTYEFTYTLQPFNYFWFPIQLLVALIISLLIFDFIPKILPGNKFIYLMCFVMLGIAIGSIAYSLATELDKYTSLIKDFDITKIYTYATESFFGNKNSYGIVLFSAVAVSLYMQIRKDRIFWMIPAFIFYIFLLFSICRTGILFATLLLVLHIVTRIILTYKKHPIRNTVYVSIIIAFLGLLTIVAFTDEYINQTIKIIIEALKEDASIKTLTGRVTLWGYAFDVLSKNNYVTGVGHGVFPDIIDLYTSIPTQPVSNPDIIENAYIEILGEGGIIALTIYLIFIVLLVIPASKCFKKNKNVAMYSIVLVLVMLAYGLLEGGNIIYPFTPEFGMLAMLCASPLYFKNSKCL